jgi:hypothetical protein
MYEQCHKRCVTDLNIYVCCIRESPYFQQTSVISLSHSSLLESAALPRSYLISRPVPPHLLDRKCLHSFPKDQSKMDSKSLWRLPLSISGLELYARVTSSTTCLSIRPSRGNLLCIRTLAELLLLEADVTQTTDLRVQEIHIQLWLENLVGKQIPRSSKLG